MTTRREEILRATIEAARIFKRFPVGERSSFDIIGAVIALDIPLLFRPLKGLWGAAITVGEDLRGVLVTTKLDLQVQRFTLAHELGHILLGHKTSLDETIGFAGRFENGSRPIEEIAADTFASELLAPKSLMRAAAKRHNWTRDALVDEGNVYQMSLRLGISFQAVCWALAGNEIIPKTKAENLQKQKLRNLKLNLVPASFLTNSWADVWRLSQGDEGSFLEAKPDDIFTFHLQENASAGFLWQLVDMGPHIQILEDSTRQPNNSNYGSEISRVVTLRFDSPGVHRIFFEHRRPWNKQKMGFIDISIENYGKEQAGFARKDRSIALAAEGL